MDGHVPGYQFDLPVDFFNGEPVLLWVVEDVESLLISKDLPDVLVAKGGVL
jgi:hypothetical protein